MSRINRLISPTAPIAVAPRAGLVALILMGSGFFLQACHQTTAPAGVDGVASVSKGAVYIRRYDKDSSDGHAKAGTIDMVVEHATFPTMEQALGQIQKMPEDLEKGYVTVLLNPKSVEPGGLWKCGRPPLPAPFGAIRSAQERDGLPQFKDSDFVPKSGAAVSPP